MIRLVMATSWVTLAVVAACDKLPEAAEVKRLRTERVSSLASRLAKADTKHDQNTPVALWVMPKGLREISGLTLTPRGLLLAHGDEEARIFVIDPRTGIVLKQFHLGSPIAGDFEGITVAGQDIWLLESNGKLYKFREGANGAAVPYTITDTRLGKECEFEGIAYQPDSAWLVLPCKKATNKGMRDFVLIYRLRLSGPDAGSMSELTVPIAQVIGSNQWKNFEPSDITIDPTNGNYVLISSQEKGLFVMTPDGDVVRSDRLPGRHPQAEGIAITADSILMLSDEQTKTPAVITLYRWYH